MEVSKFGHPSTCVGGPRQQNHHVMNIQILNNPHVRQKQNEKKALNRMKKKVDLKWDELQAQVQQMEQIKQSLLVRFTFKIVGHHWDSNMGGGVHPTKCMGAP
jgi:hypothetical protein